jgi:hypothetical protein
MSHRDRYLSNWSLAGGAIPTGARIKLKHSIENLAVHDPPLMGPESMPDECFEERFAPAFNTACEDAVKDLVAEAVADARSVLGKAVEGDQCREYGCAGRMVVKLDGECAHRFPKVGRAPVEIPSCSACENSWIECGLCGCRPDMENAMRAFGRSGVRIANNEIHNKVDKPLSNREIVTRDVEIDLGKFCNATAYQEWRKSMPEVERRRQYLHSSPREIARQDELDKMNAQVLAQIRLEQAREQRGFFDLPSVFKESRPP